MTPLELAAYQEARDFGLLAAEAARLVRLSRRAAREAEAALRSAGWSPPGRRSRYRCAARTSRTRSGRIGRTEDYLFLLATGETPERAAARLGVSARTIQRYEAALRTDALRGRVAA